MKAILEKGEYDFDSASIYFEIDRRKGISIDGSTEFTFRHNTGELSLSGSAYQVLVTLENIVLHHPKGQLLSWADMSKGNEVSEIVANNSPLLRVQLAPSAISYLCSLRLSTPRQLVRTLFVLVDRIVAERGNHYSKRPVEEADAKRILAGPGFSNGL